MTNYVLTALVEEDLVSSWTCLNNALRVLICKQRMLYHCFLSAHVDTDGLILRRQSGIRYVSTIIRYVDIRINHSL